MQKSKAFIAQEFAFANARVASSNIDPIKKRIEITLIGEVIKQQKLQEIESKLASQGLKNAELLVYQAQDQALDMTALKENIVSDLYKTNLVALEQKNQALEDMKARLRAIDDKKALWQAMSAELAVQYPQIREIYLSTANQWQKGDPGAGNELILLNVRVASKLNKEDIYRITEWLKVRAKSDQVRVVIE